LVFLRPFDNLVSIWYISPLLVYCVKKNLATLAQKTRSIESGDSNLAFALPSGVAHWSSLLRQELKIVGLNPPQGMNWVK
jgi:hypothetical protein